jgi:hypothetical protein
MTHSSHAETDDFDQQFLAKRHKVCALPGHIPYDLINQFRHLYGFEFSAMSIPTFGVKITFQKASLKNVIFTRCNKVVPGIGTANLLLLLTPALEFFNYVQFSNEVQFSNDVQFSDDVQFVNELQFANDV